MNNITFYKGVIDPTGCISNGWNLIKDNYWLYFGMSVLTYLIIACIPCVNFFMLGPITGGIYYVMLRSMRGEPIDFGMMFKGFDKFVPLMVIGILQSIPGIIFQILQYTLDFSKILLQSGGRRSGNFYQSSEAIAGALGVFSILIGLVAFVFAIVWAITFWFAIPIMLENDIDIMGAIKLSARAAWSNLGGIILLAILLGLMLIGGFIVLCIGMLFVLPIMYAANAFAFRQVFPMSDQTFETMPPPPNAYGDFGRGMN